MRGCWRELVSLVHTSLESSMWIYLAGLCNHHISVHASSSSLNSMPVLFLHYAEFWVCPNTPCCCHATPPTLELSRSQELETWSAWGLCTCLSSAPAEHTGGWGKHLLLEYTVYENSQSYVSLRKRGRLLTSPPEAALLVCLAPQVIRHY